MGQLRARMPDEKSDRRAAILKSAAELWQEQSYAAFKMSDLAVRAGVAKGTLYLYFSTKEQLFLSLLEERLFPWIQALSARLAAERDAGSKTVARLFRESLDADPALDRLLPLLESTLEHGIDPQTALDFKLRLRTGMVDLAAALEAAMPDLEKGHGIQALLMIRALHTGFRQMTDISPVIQKIHDENPQLEPMRVEFARDFESAVANALRGLTRKKGKKK